MDRLMNRMIVAAIIVGILVFAVSFMTYDDYQPIFRVIASLFMGGLCAAMAAFLTYMFSSMILLVKVFYEAGKTLPMLPGIGTRKKITRKLKKCENSFNLRLEEMIFIMFYGIIPTVKKTGMGGRK